MLKTEQNTAVRVGQQRRKGQPPSSRMVRLSIRPLPVIDPYRPVLSQEMDAWLVHCGAKYKRSTCAAYRTVAETHIRPELGRFAVSELTGEQIAAFLRRKSCGGAGQPALAPSTVCGIVTVLRAILRFAEQRGSKFHAWDALSRPRKQPHPAGVLTEEEQARLETHLWTDPDPRSLGVLTCLYTGLRIGEVCALKWEDISELGTLSVGKTVQRIRTAGEEHRTQLVFDTPKSGNSHRVIPLPSALHARLEQCRRGQECFLLTGSADALCEPRALQYYFKCILRQCGIRETNFHALRHTFATNCVQMGFDPKTLSRILGHSDVGITLNTYVHPSMSRMRDLMERLNRPVS